MIVFVPFRFFKKNPVSGLFVSGLVFIVAAIILTALFAQDYQENLPQSAYCSCFGPSIHSRICSQNDCKMVQQFNVKKYQLPTETNITPKTPTSFSNVKVETQTNEVEMCVQGESTCYEPGWKVNSILNSLVRRISSRMVTTSESQSLYLTQLISNATDDTFWNCYEKDGDVEWYASAFPVVYSQPLLISFCVLYPLGILFVVLPVIHLIVKYYLMKKEKKRNERQPLVVNSHPNVSNH